MYRRYALVSIVNNEEHELPFIDDASLQLQTKHNLVDLDYFIKRELNIQSRYDCSLKLKKYYQELYSHLNTNLPKIRKMKKQLRDEIRYLEEMSDQISFKISYKSSKNIKYLSVIYQTDLLMQYFLELYYFLNIAYQYKKDEIEQEVSKDLIYQKYKQILLHNLEYNEDFQEFFYQSPVINRFLKSHISNYCTYQYRKKNTYMSIRKNDLDFYHASQHILEQQLLTYKNIRVFMQQIKAYNEFYHDTVLNELMEELELKMNKISSLSADVNLDEIYTLYDLNDLAHKNVEYPIDGLGKKYR